MSIEAIAGSAIAKEVAGSTAIEAAAQLADKMGVNPANEILHLQPEQMYMHDDVKVGELNAPECENADVYKAREKEAAEDLKNKLDEHHQTNDSRDDMQNENHHTEDVQENIQAADSDVDSDENIHHVENSENNNDIPEKDTEKLGGSYDDVKKAADSEKEQVHHIPADSSYEGLKYGDKPAIKMETGDHRQTASFGSSLEAKEYRAKQKELIDQGKFREALQMDIDDIRSKFGNKYDEGIKQVEKYVDKLEQQGRI